MIEQWKILADVPQYAVSDLGRIKHLKGYRCRMDRILTPRRVKSDYFAVHFRIAGEMKNKQIHQLVCEAFHGPRPSPIHQVGHIDGDKHNNRADNLRWVTAAENADDRERHGTTAYGERNGNLKLSDAQVAEVRASCARVSWIARQFGISRNQVWRIRTGKSRVDVTDLRREGEAA